jgi:hypothetical protein
MDHLITVSVCGYMLAYVLVCVAAVGFLRRIGETTPDSTVTALAAAVGLGAALVGGVATGVASGVATGAATRIPTGGAVPLGALAAVLVTWLTWYTACRRRRPAAVVLLGAYDQTTSTDVWWTPDDAPLLRLVDDGLPPDLLRSLGSDTKEVRRRRGRSLGRSR